METVYSYSFLILLLPALSFVILALAGMKMSHKTAGLIGTTSLGLVTVLSYLTAFTYFGADRLADGTSIRSATCTVRKASNVTTLS